VVSDELRGVLDVSPAAWLGPRLGGEFGAVTRTVPLGYPAYARICHPAQDGAGRWVTWTEVAAHTGRQAHPTMQWHALVGSPDPLNLRGSLWPGDNPARGHLPPHVLAPLCDVLADHTSTAASCWFCLWDGYGWIHGGPSVAVLRSGEPGAPALSREQIDGPRVAHPGRNYLLFAGRLHAAVSLGHGFDAQSPNLFWPQDRAWCVASEIDFDSTLVAGSHTLVNALLQAPELDSWPVAPHDSLAADADQINLTLRTCRGR
jgi:hypothetical protein